MSKIILITGSNKGIGFEIARQCGKAGFHVIISGRNEERLKTALAKLRQEKISTDSLLMDISSRESIEKASLQFVSKKIKIDVLVNNAGIIVKGDKHLLQNEETILEQTIITNSYGPLYVTKSFLHFMQSPGRIINVSSGAGTLSEDVMGWSPAYCVSKTLLNSITKQLAYELFDNNISVNAVCPGWVRTDMGGATAPRSIEQGAETPVWLATEADQKITGTFMRDKEEIPW